MNLFPAQSNYLQQHQLSEAVLAHDLDGGESSLVCEVQAAIILNHQ
jgi:hypothetical protein